MRHLSDEALVRLCLCGRREAWDVLMARHVCAIRALARKYSPGSADVDDIVSITFLRAWKGLATFRQGASFRTWLGSIAKHSGADQRRNNRVYSGSIMPSACLSLEDGADDPDRHPWWEMLADPSPGPEAHVLAGEEAQQVERLVARLPAYFREPILMRLNGYDYAEIAALMGTGVGTVRSRLHRGKRLLREHTKR